MREQTGGKGSKGASWGVREQGGVREQAGGKGSKLEAREQAGSEGSELGARGVSRG